MRLVDEALEELAWSEPDTCQNCVFFCPWNGRGWGCSHDSVHGLLGGVCKCEGKHFKAARPFFIHGTVVK